MISFAAQAETPEIVAVSVMTKDRQLLNFGWSIAKCDREKNLGVSRITSPQLSLGRARIRTAYPKYTIAELGSESRLQKGST